MARVQIAFQDNDESRYSVSAIEEDNPDSTIHYEPALIRIENEGSLQINQATVEAHMGREWDVQSIHVNLVTLTGNIDEDDDYFKLAWGGQ